MPFNWRWVKSRQFWGRSESPPFNPFRVLARWEQARSFWYQTLGFFILKFFLLRPIGSQTTKWSISQPQLGAITYINILSVKFTKIAIKFEGSRVQICRHWSEEISLLWPENMRFWWEGVFGRHSANSRKVNHSASCLCPQPNWCWSIGNFYGF